MSNSVFERYCTSCYMNSVNQHGDCGACRRNDPNFAQEQFNNLMESLIDNPTTNVIALQPGLHIDDFDVSQLP
jgi:hypothetical protein